MKLEVSIPFHSQIVSEDGRFEIVGSHLLLQKVADLKSKHGIDSKNWPLQDSAKSPEDMLINEFIRKAKGEVFVYNHDELCHCRMVSTEKVKNAVKLGCDSISEVSRTTLAGTGCGSCRKDIEDVIKAMRS